MQLKKLRIKPVLLVLFIYMMSIFTTISQPLIQAQASDKSPAENATQSALQYYKGKETGAFSNKGTQDKEAQNKEYQAMGVYLSNYFVPYKTSLDSTLNSNGTVNIDKDMLKSMQGALKSTSGMNKNQQNNIIQHVIANLIDPKSISKQGNSLSHSLYFGKVGKVESNENNQYISAEEPHKLMEANYYDFIGVTLGDKDVLKAIKGRLSLGDKDQIAVYWKGDSGVTKTAGTFSLNPSKPTPFQQAMALSYRNSNFQSGVSNSFLGSTPRPTGSISHSSLGSEVKKYYNASMYGWKVYVDTYGDIVVDNQKKRVIVLPAVSNPMIYGSTTAKIGNKTVNPSSVNSKAVKDSGKKLKLSMGAPGEDTAVPLNNIPSMFYASGRSMYGKTVKGSNPSKMTISLPSNQWVNQLSTAGSSQFGGFFNWITRPGDSDNYNVMNLTQGSGTKGSKNNTAWNGSEQVTQGNFDRDYDDPDNLLDQITYYHYNQIWNPDNSKYMALTVRTNDIVKQDINDYLPQSQRFFIIKKSSLPDIKATKELSNTGWLKVSDDNLDSSGNYINLPKRGKVTVLNLPSAYDYGDISENINDGSKSWHSIPWTYGLYGNKGLFMSGNDSSVQSAHKYIQPDTEYPYRVNFTEKGEDNYVVIPHFGIPSSITTRGINDVFVPDEGNEVDSKTGKPSNQSVTSKEMQGHIETGVYKDTNTPQVTTLASKDKSTKKTKGKSIKKTKDKNTSNKKAKASDITKGGNTSSSVIKAGSFANIYGSNAVNKALMESSNIPEKTNDTFNSGVADKVGKQAGYDLFATTMIQSTMFRNSDAGSNDGMLGAPNYLINFANMPEYSNQGVKVTTDDDKDNKNEAISGKKANEVLDLGFNFLNPVGSAKLVATWFNTKMDGILLDIHDRMTGANSSSYTTGRTKYQENNGFVYQPQMGDTSFTAFIANKYSSWVIFLIVAMLIALILYWVRGDISLQRGILSFIVFCLVIGLPIKLTDTAIGWSNNVSSTVFNSKFNYFATAQLEDYTSEVGQQAKQSMGNGQDAKGIENAKGLSNAQDEGQYESLLTQFSNSENGEGVSLRWMAPRKDNFDGLLNTATSNDLDISNKAFGWMSSGANKNTSNQSIRGFSNNLYVTRQLSDITAESRILYGNVLGSGQNHNVDDYQTVLNNSNPAIGKSVGNYVDGTSKDDTLTGREKLGFVNQSNNNLTGFADTHKRVMGVLSTEDVANATNLISDSKITPDTVMGIDSREFNANRQLYYKDSNAFQQGINYEGSNTAQNKEETQNTSNQSLNASTVAGTGIYSIFTESPYYYFSWGLMDQGMSPTFDKTGSMKNLLLGSPDGKSDYFYNKNMSPNTPGYDEIRDFTDMGSLFHVVIPYLHRLNEQYRSFINRYGSKPYANISLQGAKANGIKQSDPNYYKYWYNYNYSRLVNQYTPWVDYMYDATYAQPQAIRYAGHSYTVQDPLNPESYLDKDSSGKVRGRPMIFSKSEMKYYGLQSQNLTDVEKKIISYNDDVHNDYLPLMNYYNFHDSTMTSIMAMTATFDFNKTFSQHGLLGQNDITLDPQSWSLNDFSYDAYMRLILANSTGESLGYKANSGSNSNQGQYTVGAGKDIDKQDNSSATSQDDAGGSIYARVLANSNIFTGILMIVSDFLTIYVLALLRYLFLIGVLVLSVLILVTKILAREANLRSLLTKSIFYPLMKIVVANVIFSYVISLFLSSGVTTVTGNLGFNIQMGVGATLIAVTFLEYILMNTYLRVIKKMIQDIMNVGRVAVSATQYVGSIATGVVTGGSGAHFFSKLGSSLHPIKHQEESDITEDDLYGSGENKPRFSSKGEAGTDKGRTHGLRDTVAGATFGYMAGRFGKAGKNAVKTGGQKARDEFNNALKKGMQNMKSNKKDTSSEPDKSEQTDKTSTETKDESVEPTLHSKKSTTKNTKDTESSAEMKSRMQAEYKKRQAHKGKVNLDDIVDNPDKKGKSDPKDKSK